MSKRKLCCIIFIIVVIILLSIFHSIKYIFLQEDLIFFEFFHSASKEKEQSKELIDTQQIMFEMQRKNIKIKDMNLMQTINNKTLVNEKIAPGTSGKFDIILKAKEDMNYVIQFKSKNNKPFNLEFFVSLEGKRFKTLEELDDILNGTILKNEKKIITIYWQWYYELNEQGDKQDTKEAKNIREYDFLIYAKGY